MKMIAIDGNSLMYRAYYALPEMATKAGTPTGALFGFLTMLLKLVELKPDRLAVAFDVHAPTFRHEKYSEYKAGRKPTPPDLLTQMALIHDILAQMNIAVVESAGYEADDFLGAFATACEKEGLALTLVTGDRDALQLVSATTTVLLTKKGISETVAFTPQTLQETYGLSPDGMRDLKALMGDSSDNIPGVPGVGEKTAQKLLAEYGTLENVLAHSGKIKGRLGERLAAHTDDARLSYWLGTINRQTPLPLTLADCAFAPTQLSLAADTLRKLELRSILAKLPEGEKEPRLATSINAEVIPVASPEQLREILSGLRGDCELAILQDPPLSFAAQADKVCRIAQGDSLFDVPIDLTAFLRILYETHDNPTILTFDAKRLLTACADADLPMPNIAFDAAIADYLLNANRPADRFFVIAEEWLGQATPHAGMLFTLRQAMLAAIRERDMTALYNDMEMPLMRVLFDMEREGFCVDEPILAEQGKALTKEQAALEGEIYELAGETFNILSPKQLGDILFDKLGLRPLRKTKRGYSTDADTLESLSPESEIVRKILDYRTLSKLLSTYIYGLIKAKSARDGRIHTTFQQCVTATGRISSVEPNLQNIPVRAQQGREIRKAFVASPGCVLLGADYSQIELRLLAHVSGDEGLINAFASGEDIHRRTASEVFRVPLQEVTQQQRGAAKAVNFGIVYGISDFGLAKNLGIPVKQAGRYITGYLEHYPKVAQYMQDSVREAREKGYAVTLFGRRRPLPEIASANYNLRSFGERVAMNMPIQGSAADIIKLAMIRVHKELAQGGFAAKLILQVHDELIVDTPESEAQAVAALMERCMVGVASLKVPLLAEVKTGKSWFDTK